MLPMSEVHFLFFDKIREGRAIEKKENLRKLWAEQFFAYRVIIGCCIFKINLLTWEYPRTV